MSDIVQRLRRQSEHNLEHCDCDVLLARDVLCIRCQSTMVEQEAADHIAALEARNARLEEQVVQSVDELHAVLQLLETNVRTKSRNDLSEQERVMGIRETLRTLTTEQTNG